MKSRSFTVLVSLILFPAVLLAAEEPPPQYQDSWASCGANPCYPIGMAADGSGNLYVVDLWNNVVQAFNPDGSAGGSWGIEGTDPGELSGAQGLDYDGISFYIADTGNHRVQKFSGSGTFIWATGTEGTGNGEFNTPSDVAADGSGNVYVVDRGNHRIQKFSSSASYVTQWGGEGSGVSQLNTPQGIGVSGSGTVYVADFLNNRVMRYNSDGSAPTVFVSPGVNEGQVNNPNRIDVDGSGNVYVIDRGGCNTDSRNCRVQKFSSGGTLLSVWGGSGFGCTDNECNGKFQDALDIAVSDVGISFVSDLRPIDTVLQGRIQQFSSNVPALPTTWGWLKARYP